MKTKFLRTQQEAGNAFSVFFELPNQQYSWEAGQYISLAFKEDDDSHDNKHWFTIASAPEEKIIQITTRDTKSTYKNNLLNLNEGDEVNISEPSGDFIWRESTAPKVFIAGGIGITPFHSIIQSRMLNKLETPAHLIYINRDVDYVFKDELDSIIKDMPKLKITYQIGKIDMNLLSSLEANLKQSLIYLSGPEPMVESVGNELLSSGIEQNLLVRDWFPGYDADNF